MDRRRRWLDYFSAWSPVLLLAGLAALTWWLDAQVAESGARRDGNSRHDPDLIVEGVRAIELDKDGNPSQVLSAARARHYPDDGTVEFEAPRFVMNQPDRGRFTVEAARARVSGDRENAYFEGGVRAVRESGPAGDKSGAGGGPITLTTEYLHVVPKQDRAQTDKAVTIEEPRGIIRATGLTLDNTSKSIKLNAEVRGTLAPPTAK